VNPKRVPVPLYSTNRSYRWPAARATLNTCMQYCPASFCNETDILFATLPVFPCMPTSQPPPEAVCCWIIDWYELLRASTEKRTWTDQDDVRVGLKLV